MSTEHSPERRILSVEDDSGTTLSSWYVCVGCTPDTIIKPGQQIVEWPCPHAPDFEALRAEIRRELAEELYDRHSGTCGCGCTCASYVDPDNEQVTT